MNNVQLAGRIAEPRIKNWPNGGITLNVSLVTNERIKKGEQWEDHAEWHNVVIGGKRGEALSRLLAKGDFIVVTGKLRTRSYEKNGQQMRFTEVLADDVELTGRGGQRQQQAEPQQASAFAIDDSDLPF